MGYHPGECLRSAESIFEVLLLPVDLVVQFLHAVRERLVFAPETADGIFQIAHLVVQRADGFVLGLFLLLARSRWRIPQLP